MSLPGARLAVAQIGATPREVVLEPPAAARAALAARLEIADILRLVCRLRIARSGDAAPVAHGTLEAELIRQDVSTAEPFVANISDRFILRFVPEAELSDTIDPDDPMDEVGYAGSTIDLEEVLYEQLALALDPYPRLSAD